MGIFYPFITGESISVIEIELADTCTCKNMFQVPLPNNDIILLFVPFMMVWTGMKETHKYTDFSPKLSLLHVVLSSVIQFDKSFHPVVL